MIEIIRKSLGFWTDMLLRKKKFSLTRYWDGELAAIVGRGGKNCDSCRYFPELGEALRKTIEYPKEYYHCLYFPYTHDGTKKLRRQFIDYLFTIKSTIIWYDSMIFQQAFEQGRFHNVIASLLPRNVIFIGGKHLQPIEKVIEIKEFIEVPQQDAFLLRTETSQRVQAVSGKYADPVIIFCAGMASNIMIDELHGIDATMIDMGSVWDACLGLNTRIWMRKVPEHLIKRNLYGK